MTDTTQPDPPKNPEPEWVTVTCFPDKRYGACTQPGVHTHTFTRAAGCSVSGDETP